MAASQRANIDQTCKYFGVHLIILQLAVLAEVERFLHWCIGTEVMGPRPFPHYGGNAQTRS